ncbi:MAG: ABC transporter substrate-binding protein [Erysipelotrichaceae bacterium]|nr:ABC transporter substrate-binding protein [Erysipelotrichaceae bacterium]MDY5251645.1 ABC transporter substrate-binding protein [Erysipelotrichaceae bacterium]
MKKLIKGLLALALCLSISACATSTSDEKPATSVPSTAEATTGFTIEDHAGRTVTFEEMAQTVASGYYIVTSTLLGLDCEDALVGVEMKADSRKIYSMVDPKIVELPSLGNKKNFNIEACVEADPDVVFLPISLKDYVEQLEALDMKVVLLSPESTQSFDDAVKILAKVMGKEEISAQYFAYRDELLAKYIKPQENKKRVYFAGSTILEAAGGKMFQNELIAQAYGEYVFAQDLQDVASWQNINVEEIIAQDPEYIFIEQGGTSVEEILNDPALSEVTAIKNQQVYVFPSEYETWDTPNLSSCLGVLWMHAILYPESVSLEDVAKEANAFYEQFYGFDAQLAF